MGKTIKEEEKKIMGNNSKNVLHHVVYFDFTKSFFEMETFSHQHL